MLFILLNNFVEACLNVAFSHMTWLYNEMYVSASKNVIVWRVVCEIMQLTTVNQRRCYSVLVCDFAKCTQFSKVFHSQNLPWNHR